MQFRKFRHVEDDERRRHAPDVEICSNDSKERANLYQTEMPAHFHGYMFAHVIVDAHSIVCLSVCPFFCSLSTFLSVCLSIYLFRNIIIIQLIRNLLFIVMTAPTRGSRLGILLLLYVRTRLCVSVYHVGTICYYVFGYCVTGPFVNFNNNIFHNYKL